jgi:hypothetical protein
MLVEVLSTSLRVQPFTDFHSPNGPASSDVVSYQLATRNGSE